LSARASTRSFKDTGRYLAIVLVRSIFFCN